MAKVTIYDIAKRSGYSTATVSLALSDSSRIRPETKDLIRQVAQELEYTPSYIAQSLSTKSTNTLGLVVPNISNPIFSQMVSGIETYANSQGYNVLLGLSDSTTEKELHYLDMIQSKRVDGMIILPTFMDVLEKKLNDEAAFKSSIVLCGSSGASTGVDISFSKCDNQLGGYLAVEHLIKTGHKKVACIFPASDKQQYYSRQKGYKNALHAYGLDYDEQLIKICKPDEDATYTATLELIQNQKPDAIFCLSDYSTISVMRAIFHLGLRIPEDIALIGYDNISLSQYLPTALSTIDTRSVEVGAKSAELLIRKLRHEDESLQQIVFEPKLVVRESTVK